jgi:hypothetical protein
MGPINVFLASLTCFYYFNARNVFKIDLFTLKSVQNWGPHLPPFHRKSGGDPHPFYPLKCMLPLLYSPLPLYVDLWLQLQVLLLPAALSDMLQNATVNHNTFPRQSKSESVVVGKWKDLSPVSHYVHHHMHANGGALVAHFLGAISCRMLYGYCAVSVLPDREAYVHLCTCTFAQGKDLRQQLAPAAGSAARYMTFAFTKRTHKYVTLVRRPVQYSNHLRIIPICYCLSHPLWLSHANIVQL